MAAGFLTNSHFPQIPCPPLKPAAIQNQAIIFTRRVQFFSEEFGARPSSVCPSWTEAFTPESPPSAPSQHLSHNNAKISLYNNYCTAIVRSATTRVNAPLILRLVAFKILRKLQNAISNAAETKGLQNSSDPDSTKSAPAPSDETRARPSPQKVPRKPEEPPLPALATEDSRFHFRQINDKIEPRLKRHRDSNTRVKRQRCAG